MGDREDKPDDAPKGFKTDALVREAETDENPLADADQLSKAIHDLRIAKKETNNYAVRMQIAAAITKIEDVRDG